MEDGFRPVSIHFTQQIKSPMVQRAVRVTLKPVKKKPAGRRTRGKSAWVASPSTVNLLQQAEQIKVFH